MGKVTYRGVGLAAPDAEAMAGLLERVDGSGGASVLLSRLDEGGRRGLLDLFAAVFRAGMQAGVDASIDHHAPAAAAAVEGEAPVAPTPRPVRTPIQAVVERFRNSELTLPQLPEVGVELNKRLTDPDFDIAGVLELVRRDATLTAKVMALGASPVFAGGARPPRSLHDAIVRVGSRELVKYLMAFTNRRLFSFKSSTAAAAMRDLWQHSLATAVMAEQLAAEANELHPATAFLHGLLHDIGRALLLQIFDELPDAPYGPDEVQRTIDALHGQFGATLLRKWRFDDSFAEVAMFHHQPQKAFSNLEIVSAVALADVAACRMGFGDEQQTFGDEELARHPSAKLLGISPEALDFAQQQARRNFDAMAQLV